MRRRRDMLSRPRGGISLGIHYDTDEFGRFSEGIARFLGTARYLVIQTIAVVLWILLNATGVIGVPDPYPFIFLTLVLSLQAAYAAPLILLAQNRQAERDRVQAERDREINARTQADTEFLAREIAAIRLALADALTSEDLDEALERIEHALQGEPTSDESPG